MTCDNASNNDTMIDELARVLPSFAGAPNRVRCFTHVLNLVAKSLIRQFDAEVDKDEAADDADERELAELAAGLEAEEAATRASSAAEDVDEGGSGDDDPDDEFDALEELSDDEKAQFLEDIRPVKLVLAKVRCQSLCSQDAKMYSHYIVFQLRKFAFKVVNSTTLLLPAWKTLLHDMGLPEKLIPRDVRTRWNSTYDMLDAALAYREAIDRMCGAQANGLRSFELNDEEWKVVRQLREVLKVSRMMSLGAPVQTMTKRTPTLRGDLTHAVPSLVHLPCPPLFLSPTRTQVFKDATLFFSRGTPNLATVIPAMDHIDSILTTANVSHHKYSNAIRVACGLAKRVLDLYYSLTDSSTTYRIAMGKHPVSNAFSYLTSVSCSSPSPSQASLL